MSRRRKVAVSHVNHERWMVSFADFMTLLFALFVVLFAVSSVDQQKYQQMTESVEKAFGVIPQQGDGLLESRPGTPSQVSIVPPVVQYPPMNPVKSSPDKTTEQMQNLLKQAPELAKMMSLRQEERGLVLQLQESLFFDSGSAQLKPNALPPLKKLVAALEKMPLSLRVEGHTDNIPVKGSFGSNWALSAARATQVLQFLLQHSKIQPQRLSMAGYGEYHPIASNSDESGRRKNRRVDIVLLSPRADLQEPQNQGYTTQAPDSLNQELESKLSTRRN
ncbi:MAG: flagellar motor protein MotB [Candidatus Sericytochromatia bacterium]